MPNQALDLVSDVHLLADRVRVKVAGAKTPERGALISPRPSGPMLPSEHAVRKHFNSPWKMTIHILWAHWSCCQFQVAPLLRCLLHR